MKPVLHFVGVDTRPLQSHTTARVLPKVPFDPELLDGITTLLLRRYWVSLYPLHPKSDTRLHGDRTGWVGSGPLPRTRVLRRLFLDLRTLLEHSSEARRSSRRLLALGSHYDPGSFQSFQTSSLRVTRLMSSVPYHDVGPEVLHPRRVVELQNSVSGTNSPRGSRVSPEVRDSSKTLETLRRNHPLSVL